MQVHGKPQGGTTTVKLERTDTPGIYRRGESYVTVWRQNGRQRKTTFSTLGEAKAAKEAHGLGKRVLSVRPSFDDYAREWMDTYRGRTRRGLARSTRADYRRSLELYAIPYFGGSRMTDIAPRDVRGFVDQLEDLGQAASSVRKNFAPVRALMATAVEDGVMDSNPAGVIRVVGARGEWHEPKRKALTREELSAFFAALPEEWAPMFKVLVQTGLRISEAIGLTWSDLELEGPRPAVAVKRQIYRGHVATPKSRYGRRKVPLTRGTAGILVELRSRTPFSADSDPVFSTPRGTPLDVSNLRVRVLRPAAKLAGLEPLGFHAFRHTCASLLFDAGRNIKQIQVWLGHHDPGFTLSTYVHLVDDGLGDTDFLDDAFEDAA